MPTIPRRPAALPERDRRQARRLRAAELFGAGVHQAEVARQLEVSAQAVIVWHGRWQAGGADALRSRGSSGPTPRLSNAQLATVEQALLEGATAHGFVGELWTLDRIASVIERLTGVRHHPAHVWALLHTASAGACSGPSAAPSSVTRTPSTAGQAALAADQANAQQRRACLVFFDESALSLTPNVRRTWAPRGHPPGPGAPVQLEEASMAAGLCYGVRGGGAQLCFISRPATTTPTP